MAVGSQKLAGPRTPLPDGQLKDESQKDDSLSDMEEDPNQIVQVPSSIPHSEQQDAGLYEGDKEEFQTNDQVREAKDARSNDPADIKEDEPRTEEEADANEGIDLEAMDWLAFQAEYMKALKSADEEENALIEEFERLSTVSFGIHRKATSLNCCRHSRFGLKLQANMITPGLLNGKDQKISM